MKILLYIFVFSLFLSGCVDLDKFRDKEEQGEHTITCDTDIFISTLVTNNTDVYLNISACSEEYVAKDNLEEISPGSNGIFKEIITSEDREYTVSKYYSCPQYIKYEFSAGDMYPMMQEKDLEFYKLCKSEKWNLYNIFDRDKDCETHGWIDFDQTTINCKTEE